MSTMTPETLRQWRDDHQYTQQTLANTLGVTSQAVRNWEAGRRPIPPWLRLALTGIVSAEDTAALERRISALEAKVGVGQ